MKKKLSFRQTRQTCVTFNSANLSPTRLKILIKAIHAGFQYILSQDDQNNLMIHKKIGET